MECIMQLAIYDNDYGTALGYVSDSIFTKFSFLSYKYTVHVLGWNISSFPKSTVAIVTERETDDGHEEQEEEIEVVLIPSQLTKKLFITHDDELVMPVARGLLEYREYAGHWLHRPVDFGYVTGMTIVFYFSPTINVNIFYDWFGANFVDNMKELYDNYIRAN